MDLGKLLIECKAGRDKRNWKGLTVSVVLHTVLLGSFIFLSLSATERAVADEKAIPVYLSQAAAPPPPPPPPPPPAGTPARSQPQVQPKIEPVEVPQETFVQPQEVPQEIPVVNTPVVDTPVDPGPPSSAPVGGVPGGVEGGVVGGVVGGVQGGTLGGQIGGQIGGVLGGTPGGVVGGTPGGTGTEPAPAPSGPLRVGGDVKAPRISNRVEPKYTEVARRARIQGVVIVEAIIDKHGNVDRVKVIRGLPMGLSESAVSAVKQWKFRPGTLNGASVDVIFNLTVNFRLTGDGPTITKETSRPVMPEREPDPAPQPAQEPTPEPAPEPEQPQVQELPQPPQQPAPPPPTDP